MVPNWVYGTMILVVFLHVATLYLARANAGRSTGADDPERYVSEGTVECPECSAENERGYRFCRSCVSELPGAVARERASGPARAGRLF